ncbi:MAG TPA: ABC transporter substrate-binding protein [Tepidiformaceae bacterium]
MKENYWTKMETRRLRRRGFLAGAGAAGAGLTTLALVGCGGDDEDDDSDITGTGDGVQGQPTTSGETAQKGGVIRFAHTADADHFDPALETTWLMNLGPHVYSKLIRWNGAITEMLPDLAESLPEQVDDTTYTFKLRPGLKFSDGSPLTAADVKFTFERVGAEKTASPHRYKVGPLQGIDTPDDNTVTFKLTKAFAPFVSFMATGWMMVLSQKWVEAKGDKYQEPLGSGPFMVGQRQKTVSTKFVRNPNHWNAERPYADEMDFRVIPDSSTVVSAVIANELDFLASTTDKSVVQQILGANRDIVDMEHAAHHWNMFIMNCSDSSAFKDKRLRQAMNLLIDRELYQKIVHSTGGKPSGPVTWGFSKYAIPQDELTAMPGYRKDKTEDIKAAKELLSAAGFASGLKLNTATTTAAAHATYNAGALALKDQLSQYGIELELGVTDMAGIQAKRASGAYDCMVYVNGGSQEIDEHIYGPNYTGQPRNVNRFSNPDIDKLLDKQRVTLDEEERKTVIREIQGKLLEDVPTAWLADPVYHSLVNKRLQGYQPWLVFDRSAELADAWIKA